MDESDQDFVDLCFKPLKRVRKKPGEPKQPRRAERQASTQPGDGDKRRRNNVRHGGSGSKCAAAVNGTQPVCGEAGNDPGDSGSPGSTRFGAKDKVVHRMQQFRRAGPQKMLHQDHGDPDPPPAETQEPSSPGLCLDLVSDSDEALALRLQQELDREAAEAQILDLEDRGLFFCQICHRDLSHMSPEGRSQHLNRCLDEAEPPLLAPPPPPPTTGVPDCPICGKKFKSQKSRSTHLKRCSSDMGVSPAVLLQALQRQKEERQTEERQKEERQTEERQISSNASTLAQTGGTKRKVPSKPGLPARKKPRKKTDPLDEDTMVAMALSSSLLQQERESQTETAAAHASIDSTLKWRTDAGKVRGKRKKGAVPRPPPLLLVQDAAAALTRLQERVSSLLLRSRPPSPPTPTRRPSRLPGWSGAAPLWQKSALLSQDSACVTDFYTAELREFITPWESALTDVASSGNKPDASLQPRSEGTPVTNTRLLCSQTGSSSPAPVGSQALRDLMELAEDGMTLTQCGFTAPDPAADKNAELSAKLHLSGFVPEEAEEQDDLCVNGRAGRSTNQPGPREERGSRHSVALSRLASELSSMVNNPQLSDVQLQVDSGEVYFAHSFMVYARCPLLAEMVHESGFMVQEEGVPAAQRVLMSDVPGQAVLALLQYLYTAQYSAPASLQPHVLELASRFDLQELQQLCELHRDETVVQEEEEGHPNDQTDAAFMVLLRSMWNEEEDNDDGDEGADSAGRSDEERGLDQCRAADVTAGDRDASEERVNEEEMEEIYEFAATQRKRQEEEEEEEEEAGEEEDEVFTKLIEPRRKSSGLGEKNLQPTSSLDRSYNRLFSESFGVYRVDEDPSSSSSLHPASPPQQTHTLPSQKQQPSQKLRTLLQSSGSVVDDLSPSPPPCSLPIPGLSPRKMSSGDATELEASPPLKRESQGPRSICLPLSPDSSKKKEKPELIVLSDSSEDMDVDVAVLSSRSPSPTSPLQSYTGIKPQSSPSVVTVLSPPGDHNPADCSPEVSWLVPSTPVQARTTASTSSSTQTRSSMCRTQLFPKGDDASSSRSSSVFSSPPLPLNSSTRDPSDVGVSRICSSSLDLNLCPKRTSNTELPVFKEPQLLDVSGSTQHHLLQVSSKQDASLQPYSSTPLHKELPPPPGLPAASPFQNEPDHQRQTSPEKDPESPEKTELQSFHLSPLSNPANKPSSSSHQSSQSYSKASSQSPRSVESSRHDRTGSELRSSIRNEEGGTELQSANKSPGDEGEQEEDKGEGKEADSSFQQSFTAMDEPPIAFNDSWGFDIACSDPAANPGRFSLRLEDSGASNQQERSLETEKCAITPSPPDPTTTAMKENINSLLDSKIWDSWEEEEEVLLPLSQRVNPSTQFKTPAQSHKKKRRSVVPITPMPHFSDLDTPELKTKLNRFGVRPLPKRQMILKLKEIHQYTHQLASSDSEDEDPPPTAKAPSSSSTAAAGSRPVPCHQTVTFKKPSAVSPGKLHREEEEAEPLSSSQGSNTSSTAASEESERSNPELYPSSDSDSDSTGDVPLSQAEARLQDRLQAVRAFILSDSALYSQILQYQPVVLSQLQQRLKAAGIRLGATKLVDFLDSQCITFTTAKPGRAAPSRRRGKKAARGAKAASRRRGIAASQL